MNNLPNIYNSYDLYDLYDLYDINNTCIEKKYKDNLKKIIFIINNGDIFSLKCEFYSGNIIDIDISKYNHQKKYRNQIDIGKILYNKNDITESKFIINIKNENYIDEDNNSKVHFNFPKNSYWYTEVKNNTLVYFDYDSNIFFTTENKKIICEFICVKSELIKINYNEFVYSKSDSEIILNTILTIINVEYIVNKYGYINLKNTKIINDIRYNSLNNNYNTNNNNIDIIYKYYFINNILYLLLIKFGNITFNDHITCKLCENIFKNNNNNNFIFRHIFKHIILCRYHSKIYFKKIKNIIHFLRLNISLLFKKINSNNNMNNYLDY